MSCPKHCNVLKSAVPKKESGIVRPAWGGILKDKWGMVPPVHPFRVWVQKVLPQVYDDSLSYAELIYKVMWYMNTLIKNVETVNENMELLKQAYADLECFVLKYFDKLDITGELEDLLDKAIYDGTVFTQLLGHITFGVGVGGTIEDSTITTTETTTVSYSEYIAECKCCDECCDCCYYTLEDGDTVSSTYKGDGVTVVTTIVRDGDNVTTTVKTTEETKNLNIYGKIKAGSGILVEEDEDGYYKISTLASAKLSDNVPSSDYTLTLHNNFYPLYSTAVNYSGDYDHVVMTDVATEDLEGYGYHRVTGTINYDVDGNLSSCTVQIRPTAPYGFRGNLADTDLFMFKHSASIGERPQSIVWDVVFDGDYGCLSDTSYSVSTEVTSSSVWNIYAVNADPSIEFTSSEQNTGTFGASWSVYWVVNTATVNGKRHFYLCPGSIGDGWNSQYNKWGDYMYSAWLNYPIVTISLSV